MNKLNEIFMFRDYDGTSSTPRTVDSSYEVVKRSDGYFTNYSYYKYRNWGELSRKRQLKELGKSVGKLVAVAAGALIVQVSWGQPGEAVSDEQVDSYAVSATTEKFSSATALDQYEMTYLAPKKTTYFVADGGTGLRGWRSDNSNLYAAGQDCLVDTGYNTNPSVIRGRRINGEITPAASLSRHEDGAVAIYPSGSITPPLVFEFSDTGLLQPDANTERTLRDHGCTTEGLPLVDVNNPERFSTTIQ